MRISPAWRNSEYFCWAAFFVLALLPGLDGVRRMPTLTRRVDRSLHGDSRRQLHQGDRAFRCQDESALSAGSTLDGRGTKSTPAKASSRNGKSSGGRSLESDVVGVELDVRARQAALDCVGQAGKRRDRWWPHFKPAMTASVLFKPPATSPAVCRRDEVPLENVTVGAIHGSCPASLTIPDGKRPVSSGRAAGPGFGPERSRRDGRRQSSSSRISPKDSARAESSCSDTTSAPMRTGARSAEDHGGRRSHPGRRRGGEDAAGAARRGAGQDFRRRAQPRRDAGAGNRQEGVAGCGNRDARAVGPQAASSDRPADAIPRRKRRRRNWRRSSAKPTKSRRTRCRRRNIFFGAPASYYYDLDARDEVAIARSLDVPILILHGSRDYQVIDEDIRDWQNGLKGDAKVQVDTFPGLNHLFIAGAGKPGPAEYDDAGHVDVAVIATIASFVSNARSTSERRRIDGFGDHRCGGHRRAAWIGRAQGVREDRRPHDALVFARRRRTSQFDRRSCDNSARGIRKCGARRSRGCRAWRAGQDYAGRYRASGFGSNRARTDQFGERTGDSARRGASAGDAGNFRGVPGGGGASRRCDRGDTGGRHFEARRRTARSRRPSREPGYGKRKLRRHFAARCWSRRIDAQSARESSRPMTRTWSNGREFASKWSKARPRTSRSRRHPILAIVEAIVAARMAD